MDIAAASHLRLTAGTAAAVLDATTLPEHDLLAMFVHVLGGDRDHFSELLRNALRETVPGTVPLPGAKTAPASLPAASPDAVKRAFSKICAADETAQDGSNDLLRNAVGHSTLLPRARAARPRPAA